MSCHINLHAEHRHHIVPSYSDRVFQLECRCLLKQSVDKYSQLFSSVLREMSVYINRESRSCCEYETGVVESSHQEPAHRKSRHASSRLPDVKLSALTTIHVFHFREVKYVDFLT